jgi:hypothetical protein
LFFEEFSFFELPVYSGYQSFVWCIAKKDFLPFCGWPLQFSDNFFCCADILISCSPICLSILLDAGPLKVYWGSPCLCLLLPEYSLIFPVLTSRFQVW